MEPRDQRERTVGVHSVVCYHCWYEDFPRICCARCSLFAEILVDVVDVILKGSGIDEKFLGVTLFALVPNTTEFMNAMSFALNGNIA